MASINVVQSWLDMYSSYGVATLNTHEMAAFHFMGYLLKSSLLYGPGKVIINVKMDLVSFGHAQVSRNHPLKSW